MTPARLFDLDRTRWVDFSARLDRLLDAHGSGRRAELDRIRVEDPVVAAELETLLAQQDALNRDAFLAGSVLPSEHHRGEGIGRYALEHRLGRGSAGCVWLARRNGGRHREDAAIKFLNVSSMGPSGIRRFRREGKMLAALSHPNIVRLLGAGETGSGQPYLVLEHVDGMPIDAWCDARALDTAARVRIFLDVLGAVSHVHAKRILHRDLKPSNILVTRDGQVKLIDFGIALSQEDADPASVDGFAADAGTFTVDFAAPEQLHSATLTTATDVYALGVLFYLLLAGVHPTARAGSSLDERLRAIDHVVPLHLSIAAAPALCGGLEDIVAKALRKEPAARYQTASEMAVDLRRHGRRSWPDGAVHARGDRAHA